MKRTYFSPETKIILWEDEVFLYPSEELFEDKTDNLFNWTWGE